ncbi:MAG: hypothetical protein M3Z04_23465 [Chloroflexota bacterium]|nr:hypothetical protein [Chloroflexota bacterium]
MNQSQQRGPLAGLGSGISRILLIVGVAVLALCACLGFTVFRGLLPGGATPTARVPTALPISGGVPTGSGPQISTLTLTTAVAAGNSPANPTQTFATGVPIIYAVADTRNIRAGDTFFARWSRNGQPLEDTKQLVADRAYPRTNTEFHIQPSGRPFQAGNYTVQVYINGNPGPQAAFVVR